MIIIGTQCAVYGQQKGRLAIPGRKFPMRILYGPMKNDETEKYTKSEFIVGR